MQPSFTPGANKWLLRAAVAKDRQCLSSPMNLLFDDSMLHIPGDCPLTRFDGGLGALHFAAAAATKQLGKLCIR